MSNAVQNRRLRVDDQLVEVWIEGAGTPTVIFENGGMGNASNWQKIQQLIAEHCTSIAYTRTPFEIPNDESHVEDPETTNSRPYLSSSQFTRMILSVIEATNLPPPFILVGHSLGGFYVRFLAESMKGDAAGIIFVDARSPKWIGKLEQLVQESSIASGVKFRIVEELEQVRSIYRSAEKTGPFSDTPITVIGADPVRLFEEFRARGFSSDLAEQAVAEINQGHCELKNLSTNGRFVEVSGSGHAVPAEAPDAIAKCIVDLAGFTTVAGG